MQQGNPCQGSDVGDVASSQSVRLRSSNRASRSEFALATHPAVLCKLISGPSARSGWVMLPNNMTRRNNRQCADMDLDQRRRRTSWLLR